MFRLFGKSKRDTGTYSPEGSNASPDHEEQEGAEGFTVLEPKSSVGVPSHDIPPSYNSVTQLPYQLPGRGGGNLPAPARQNSTPSNPLAGVQFTLSPRLTTDTEIQYITAAVDSVMARVKGIEWAAFEYNFNLEQSVLGTTQEVEDGVGGLDIDNSQ